jgi:hypothetical protein
MHQSNFATPHSDAVAAQERPPPLSERGPHTPRTTARRRRACTPQRHTPNTPPAPPPTLRADALFSLCRSPYPWLHPLLPLLALARVKVGGQCATGTSKRATRALTPPPLRRPPRHRGASLPLRTSDGRVVDRVHRARSLPTASVHAGARADSRALARRPAPRRSLPYCDRREAPSERSRQETPLRHTTRLPRPPVRALPLPPPFNPLPPWETR